MTAYFMTCKNLDELKKEYNRLARLHHPDLGGDTATMQEINRQHDERFEQLKHQHNTAADEHHQTTETAEEFREIILRLLILDGLEIELCGSWLWIGGETRTHKEELKRIGCRWSNNKKLWYWHHVEAGRRWHRGTATIGEIRNKYGSTKIRNKGGKLEELTA